MYSKLMNVNGIMSYIIENELTDSIVLALHPDNFDMVAMDYIRTHGTIERPFELLGIAIVEDTTGSVSRNQIAIIEI